MPKDPADLGDVEPQVDDQVAGDGVSQIMDPQSRQHLRIQPGPVGRPPQPAPLDVAGTKRSPERGGEDVVVVAGVGGGELVLFQERFQLRKQRDLPHRRGRF